MVFFAASHGGVGGCLSVPGGAIAAATTAVKCTLATINILEGNASVGLSGLVETGRTYSIILKVRARVEKGVNLTTGKAQISGSRRADLLDLNIPPLLTWKEMIVEFGTDPALVAADLQDQIDALRADLENHTHTFLTGRGVGHNNTEAETSSALLPAQ